MNQVGLEESQDVKKADDSEQPNKSRNVIKKLNQDFQDLTISFLNTNATGELEAVRNHETTQPKSTPTTANTTSTKPITTESEKTEINNTTATTSSKRW